MPLTREQVRELHMKLIGFVGDREDLKPYVEVLMARARALVRTAPPLPEGLDPPNLTPQQVARLLAELRDHLPAGPAQAAIAELVAGLT